MCGMFFLSSCCVSHSRFRFGLLVACTEVLLPEENFPVIPLGKHTDEEDNDDGLNEAAKKENGRKKEDGDINKSHDNHPDAEEGDFQVQ